MLDVENTAWMFASARCGDVVQIRNTAGPPQQLAQHSRLDGLVGPLAP
jgi:hypothetical protein